MSAQVDYDLLADYVGGALDGTPEHKLVAGLIATSPEWGRAADELAAALAGVSHDLRVLRERPEPMPEEVAALFEGLFDPAGRDPLAPRVVNRRSRAGAAGRANRWKRWAPAAIVAAALGLFAVGWVPALVSPTAQDKAGVGSDNFQADAPAAMPPTPVPTAMTWRTYDRDSLRIVPPPTIGTLSAESAQSRSTTGKMDSTLPLQRLTDPFALQQCLNAVNAVLPGRVELVEYAYFEGIPALVISVTSRDGLWRFVAGANCGQRGPDERFRAPLK